MSEMDAPKMESIWDNSPRGHTELALNLGVHHNSMMSPGSSSQYERNLNFTATGGIEENEYGFPKKKTVRDPLSHRIIEKRRRDRMNNCLADLARLLPPSSLRKGRGRIEKTEIVELAIKHLKHLQCHPCPSGDKCEFNYIVKGHRSENCSPTRSCVTTQVITTSTTDGNFSTFPSTPEEHFRLGFNECLSEAMHFLVEEEGMYPGDSLCIRILKHLRSHSENLMREHFGKDGKLRFHNEPIVKEESRKKADNASEFSINNNNNGSSSSSGYQANGSSSSGSDGNCSGGQDLESQESFQIPVPNGNAVVVQRVVTSERHPSINIDYEGENSCCSTQLSLDISDVCSDTKSSATRNSANVNNKPPIPTIIGSSLINGSSTTHSCSNGRSSDDGQDGTDNCGSNHRYKFKNNIKQRFVADLVPSSKKANLITKASLKQNENDEEECALNLSPHSENENEERGESSDSKLITATRNSSPQVQTDEESVSNKSYSVERKRRNSNNSSKTISNVLTPKTNTNKVESPRIEDDNLIEEPLEPRDIKLSKEELLLAGKVGESWTRQTKPSQLPTILGEQSQGVPAFALYEKGLYYIPMTIDKSMLSPYLSGIDSNHVPPLHPVTISVSFLISQTEQGKRIKENDSSSISQILPNAIETMRPIPASFPIITSSPLAIPAITTNTNTTNVKGTKPSSKDAANNYLMNRFHSAQYNNPAIAYHRYPISSGNSPHIATQPSPQNLNHKDFLSHQQYYPSYYVTDPTHNNSNSGLIPSHNPMHGGYTSTSSSSSNSSSVGNHHGRGCSNSNSRKRSIASLSPGSVSGTSSLGYHSFNDKYSPNSAESYQTYHHHPHQQHYSSTNSNQSSQNNHGTGRHHQHHHHSSAAVVPTGHNQYASFPSNLLHFRSDERSAGNLMTERQSSSPTKRSRKNKDNNADDLIKPKPVGI